MASRSEQVKIALAQKIKAENRFKILITPLLREITATYKIGKNSLSDDQQKELTIILNRFYTKTASNVLGFDIREYKQTEDDTTKEIFVLISGSMANEIMSHGAKAETSIADTFVKFMQRTTYNSLQNNWSEREAKVALGNYLNNHMLTIAVSESQWTVETTRKNAVLLVNDPLKNSVEQVAYYIEQGDYKTALKISRQVEKLTHLPLSVNQGKLVRTISDNRSKLLTPITQGEAIANMRRAASKLDKTEKKWNAIGDSVTRATHNRADGQTRDVSKPFEVGGALMQYPGDGSLGAPLSEIVNCRCVSEYI